MVGTGSEIVCSAFRHKRDTREKEKKKRWRRIKAVGHHAKMLARSPTACGGNNDVADALHHGAVPRGNGHTCAL